MRTEMGDEFITIMEKIRKLHNRAQPMRALPHAEFMALNAIEIFSKQKSDSEIWSGVQVSKISGSLHTSKPAISKMLNTLEDKGYIIRMPDKKDRRVVYIQLTEEGQHVLDDAKLEVTGYTKRILAKLGEEDAEDLIRIMQKLYEIVKDELDYYN